MIDLHCHLIPGVDDGPNTLEESLKLCRIAVADGISHAICTPHIHPGRWENTRHSIAQQCDHLQQQLNQQGIPLHLGFAGEVRLTDRIMDQVENEEIPFYGAVDGYSVMLLEFPHGHVIPGSEKLVAWLLDRNIRPLIAHPERNRQLMKDPAQIGPFVTAGCWLQITAGSLLGNFGARAQKTADLLLRNDMVAVLASDGHNAAARQPVLKRAFSLVVDRFGTDKARQLMLQTPGIIAGGQFGERAAIQ